MHNFNLNIETATLFSGLPFSLDIHIIHVRHCDDFVSYCYLFVGIDACVQVNELVCKGKWDLFGVKFKEMDICDSVHCAYYFCAPLTNILSHLHRFSLSLILSTRSFFFIFAPTFSVSVCVSSVHYSMIPSSSSSSSTHRHCHS